MIIHWKEKYTWITEALINEVKVMDRNFLEDLVVYEVCITRTHSDIELVISIPIRKWHSNTPRRHDIAICHAVTTKFLISFFNGDNGWERISFLLGYMKPVVSSENRLLDTVPENRHFEWFLSILLKLLPFDIKFYIYIFELESNHSHIWS